MGIHVLTIDPIPSRQLGRPIGIEPLADGKTLKPGDFYISSAPFVGAQVRRCLGASDVGTPLVLTPQLENSPPFDDAPSNRPNPNNDWSIDIAPSAVQSAVPSVVQRTAEPVKEQPVQVPTPSSERKRAWARVASLLLGV